MSLSINFSFIFYGIFRPPLWYVYFHKIEWTQNRMDTKPMACDDAEVMRY